LRPFLIHSVARGGDALPGVKKSSFGPACPTATAPAPDDDAGHGTL